jgi:hypothetical protein
VEYAWRAYLSALRDSPRKIKINHWEYSVCRKNLVGINYQNKARTKRGKRRKRRKRTMFSINANENAPIIKNLLQKIYGFQYKPRTPT